MPPSMNEIWRSNRGRVHRSKVYISWLQQAGLQWLTQKQSQPRSILGHFKAILVLDNGQRGQKDCDNRGKAPLDFCKVHGIISDDKFCDAILIKWGKAPAGAKLILLG